MFKTKIKTEDTQLPPSILDQGQHINLDQNLDMHITRKYHESCFSPEMDLRSKPETPITVVYSKYDVIIAPQDSPVRPVIQT